MLLAPSFGKLPLRFVFTAYCLLPTAFCRARSTHLGEEFPDFACGSGYGARRKFSTGCRLR
jgi:hypothetical protein